jgi:hypothetical protein
LCPLHEVTGSVVQWIEYKFPELRMQVRFLPGLLGQLDLIRVALFNADTFSFAASSWLRRYLIRYNKKTGSIPSQFLP